MSQLELEQQQTIRAEAKKNAELVDQMRMLTSLPAWNTFRELVERHLHSRVERVLLASNEELKQETPPTTVERVAGEATGLRLALRLPQMILDAAPETKGEDDEVQV
jgi:hypothetical protein